MSLPSLIFDANPRPEHYLANEETEIGIIMTTLASFCEENPEPVVESGFRVWGMWGISATKPKLDDLGSGVEISTERSRSALARPQVENWMP